VLVLLAVNLPAVKERTDMDAEAPAVSRVPSADRPGRNVMARPCHGMTDGPRIDRDALAVV
jgi:hypothetical protein